MKRMKKFLALLCAGVLLSTAVTVQAQEETENGWTKDENGEYYYLENGEVRTGWFQDMEDDGNWYYLKETEPGLGQMQKGWIVDSTGWKTYFLDSNGRMASGQWINVGEDNELGRPAGMYYLTDDGAVQMNGWAESITPGIYWYLRAGDGWFDRDNPACWSTDSSLVPEQGLDKESEEAMIPVLGAIMGCTLKDTGELEYYPDDPEYVWTALGIGIAEYVDIEDKESVMIDGRWYFGVPADLVEEYAAGMFADMESLPEPLDNEDWMRYDAERDYYFFKQGDSGDVAHAVTGSRKIADGEYLLDIARTNSAGDETYITGTVRIVRNTHFDDGREPLFPYSVKEVVN